MALTQMEHYLVLAEDLEATKDFYCEALGMRVGARPPLEFPGYWLYLGDTPCVHLGEWRSYSAHAQNKGLPVTTKALGTGSLDHIAFNATNFDEVMARLRTNKVEVQLNIVPGIGLRQLFLRDPNGLKIEINIPADLA